MSQTFPIPISGSEPLTSSRGPLNDALDSLRSCFSGATAPTSPSPVTGQVYFNTSSNTFFAYNGTGWVAVIGPISVSDGGVILSDGSVAMAADLSMGSNKITSLGSATASTDAVNKGQLDSSRKVTSIRLGDVTATTLSYVFALGVDATIVSCAIVSSSSPASTGTDRWELNVRNEGTGLDLRSSSYNTNTDGDPVAGTRLDIGLDQNLSVSTDQVLRLDITKFASGADLNNLSILVEYTVAV